MDFEQGNFSIAHDEHLIIPLALRAQRAAAASAAVADGGGGELQFVSSPWSPPGWMKVPYGLDKHKVLTSTPSHVTSTPSHVTSTTGHVTSTTGHERILCVNCRAQ